MFEWVHLQKATQMHNLAVLVDRCSTGVYSEDRRIGIQIPVNSFIFSPAEMPDPFAKIVVDGSGQCHLTEPIKSTLDPKWNQHYDL